MQRWMNLTLFLIVLALVIFSLVRSIFGTQGRQADLKQPPRHVRLPYGLDYVAASPKTNRAQAADTRIQDMERALNLSTPVQRMLVFKAQVVPPSPQTQNRVAVQYTIDAQSLRFQHGDDGLVRANVECAAQAFTDRGEAVKASASIYHAALQPESFKLVSEMGFPCTQNLDLPAGNYLLKLAVRDNGTGAIGTLNTKVEVPQLPANAPRVIKPERKGRGTEKPRSREPRMPDDPSALSAA